MEKEIPESIRKALLDFQKKVRVVDKDQTVEVKTQKGKFRYMFASYAKVIDTIRKPLEEVGLGFTHKITPISVQTVLYTEEDNYLASEFPIKFAGSMQDQGMSISYAKRYSLVYALGLSAETDNDGHEVKTANEYSEHGKQFQKLKSQVESTGQINNVEATLAYFKGTKYEARVKKLLETIE